MKLTKFIAAFAIMITAATAVNAQSATNRSDKSKIKQGVKTGELTKAETRNLAEQQRDIRKDVRVAKADGDITRAERKHIKREKKQADRTIYRKKHNDKDRD